MFVVIPQQAHDRLKSGLGRLLFGRIRGQQGRGSAEACGRAALIQPDFEVVSGYNSCLTRPHPTSNRTFQSIRRWLASSPLSCIWRIAAPGLYWMPPWPPRFGGAPCWERTRGGSMPKLLRMRGSEWLPEPPHLPTLSVKLTPAKATAVLASRIRDRQRSDVHSRRLRRTRCGVRPAVHRSRPNAASFPRRT